MRRKALGDVLGFDVPAILRECYCLEISKVCARAADITRSKLAPLKIVSRDYVAMALLAPTGEPATQSILVKQMGISPNLVLAMIDNLDSLGYTKRVQNPQNRRENLVLLTKRGRDVYEQAALLVREAEEELLAPLSLEEREQCRALTRKLYEPVS
jgi:DNA-binding MarR family transcriptional regulator